MFTQGLRPGLRLFRPSGSRTLRLAPGPGAQTPALPSAERQQGDVARLLDGVGQAALVRRAHAGQTAGNDLAAFRHEGGEQAHVLVVDAVDFLDAEFANLLATEEFPSAFAGTARATAGSGPDARRLKRMKAVQLWEKDSVMGD